jgi:hypothetical protein
MDRKLYAVVMRVWDRDGRRDVEQGVTLYVAAFKESPEEIRAWGQKKARELFPRWDGNNAVDFCADVHELDNEAEDKYGDVYGISVWHPTMDNDD